MIRSVFDRTGVPLLAIGFIVLFAVEKRFSLRRRVQNVWKRTSINFLLSLPAFTLLRLLLLPVMVSVARKNTQAKFGLLYLTRKNLPMLNIIAFLLIDYTNYLWHVLLHRLPFLWRFHLVHHTDLDLDVTTAFRFHFGEMIGSTFFRTASVFCLGASPLLVILYEIGFEGATEFHHSNVRLPIHIERFLNYFLVTPRMHGIHHSVNKEETDSNYSVIFSFWDRLHRTARLNVTQDKLVIGVPAYRDERELNVGDLLKMPFHPVRPWKLGTKEPGPWQDKSF